MYIHSDTLILILRQPVFALTPQCCLLSREATNTNFIVFALTRPRLKHTFYYLQKCTTLEASTLTITPLMRFNRIDGVMVSVLASSAVERGFEPRSGQTKDYKIGICCFSAKHAALRSKSKDWLARNQNNVFEWSDMSTRGLLFQWTSTTKKTTKRVGLEQSGTHHHLINN